jgi:hypothetical protein
MLTWSRHLPPVRYFPFGMEHLHRTDDWMHVYDCVEERFGLSKFCQCVMQKAN